MLSDQDIQYRQAVIEWARKILDTIERGREAINQQPDNFITNLRAEYIASQSPSPGREEDYNDMSVDTTDKYWVIVEITAETGFIRTCLASNDVERLVKQLNNWINLKAPCDSCELSDGCIVQPFTSECTYDNVPQLSQPQRN